MDSQKSVGDELDQIKNKWQSFFDSKRKAVFSDKIKNSVKGSENQIRGVRNEV